MAQKLKEETRQAIIDAAREEFLEKGFADASMRSIAEKAGITVGNIYRYFENKEELGKRITAGTSQDIASMLDGLKIGNLSMEPRVFNMTIGQESLDRMMDELSVKLVALYFNKRSEFNIIINDDSLSEQIISWFRDVFSSLIFQQYSAVDLSKQREILSQAYADAVFAGLKKIFSKRLEDKKMTVNTVRVYLRRFAQMAGSAAGKGF